MTDAVPFPDLPDLPRGGFRTIKADPPWAYDDKLPGPGRGSESHYDVLHPGTVAGMGPQIREVTDSVAHLYLWTTNSFMDDALDIARAWGFTPKTIITWVKVLNAPESLPHERDDPVEIRRDFGMGHYTRGATEHIVFGVKGNLKTNANDAVNVFFAEPEEHSRKPAKSYRLAEYLSDGPRLELFSRRERPGWTTWGNETGSHDPDLETEVNLGDED